MSLGLVQPRLKVLTYNTHLFGRTGMFAGRETGLVFHDESRAEQIAARIRNESADIVGLTEVWDENLARGLVSELGDRYPYHLGTPAYQGIQDIVNHIERRWPTGTNFLLKHTEAIVDFFSQSHYQVRDDNILSGALRFIEEDTKTAFVKRLLSLPHVWGAGLLLFSRYPVSQVGFIPFEVSADLERFAGKGILKAVVHRPQQSPALVALTHAQEGESKRAMAARAQQILQMKELVEQSEYPAIAMGDFNVMARGLEYRWMVEQLGLLDTFRALHGKRANEDGYTYDHDNPYAVKLGVKRARGQGQRRIDYIFSNTSWQPHESRVLRDEFRDEHLGFFLSDHFPVAAWLTA